MESLDSQPYLQALDYLLSFIDYSRTHQQNVAPENFSLERMANLLARLGDPHLSAPSIHIAGTKGKGSTAAFCAAALQAAGYKTGLYTSPDLGDFTERIQVNRQPIPKDEFAALVEALKPHAESLPGVTSYELQTALAFLHFARQGTTANVIEVGMGGRLDSTNVVQPVVSVITSISLDHTYVLGDTLAAIAGEKGGIIKPGTPVVSAPQSPEAAAVLRSIAAERDTPLAEVGIDVAYQRQSNDLAGQHISVKFRDEPSETLAISLLGPHQAENAATAYAALRVADAAGLLVSREAIRIGFAGATWPGRFEVMQLHPPFILDGAHNAYSVQILVKTLREHFPGQPLALLFGASSDKDIAGMFAELLPETTWLLPVQSAHPRATPPAELLKLAEGFDVKTETPASIPAAIDRALELAANGGVALATGSLYSLGEIRAAWQDRH
ncbi:MAG: bifunctional folylpolyglutamate synthase/dihydrofolate synthase [Anaerolineae bacterium]|nr:MAG: bifunctional folylpolyglutamate synthase/dihydrofolate synthase [Anaerolineae bacterium]